MNCLRNEMSRGPDVGGRIDVMSVPQLGEIWGY